ncbi:MAG: YDG domain-containing protein [Treponema sp.]|nr:YDG domain-containing protein [Treponema sp.]
MNKFFSGKGRLTAGRLLSVLLLVVLVLFYGCPNPSSSSSREKEPFPGGELEGSAAITGIYKIGETLTADTSAITGNDGSFEYQWLADGDKITGAANATYTIRGADVSKVISVVITSTSATGQITATGEKVPYTIKIEINGAAADDYVSFSDTDSIVETTALEGQVTIYYAVAADKRNNELQFTGAIIPLPKVTGVVEDGIIVYTIDPDDAKDGVITIKAEYKHTDLDIDDIEFGNTANPITVFYGDGDNSFTNTITNSHNGTGTISYTSSNTDIATVDNNTGVVTILKTGTAIITAEKADDAIYAGASASYSLIISPKPVSITGLTAANKVYNGDTTTAVTGTAVISGNIDGANLTVVNGTAAFTDKNVGTDKTVTFSGFSLGGAAAGNYILSDQPANTTADITRLQLVIAAPSGSPTKIYNGNTEYTGSGITPGSLTNLAAGDTVNVSIASATYNNANVASATQITIVYGISGADAGNYFAPVNGTIAATITRATPDVNWPTGLMASEGDTLGHIALPGNGDGTPGSFSWTEGSSTLVGAEGSQLHNMTFTPTNTANYNTTSWNVTVIVGPPLLSDVVLSPSPVTFTGITYGDSQPAAQTVTITNNGTAAAAVSDISLGGASPESYTLGGSTPTSIPEDGGTVTFTIQPNANLDAGTHNAVVTVTYDGSETVWANVSITVDTKPVSITGVTAANKVYDGDTTTAVTGTAVISGNIDGANLTVVDGTAAFTDKNVGTGKTVTFSGFSLGGTAAGNYTLSDQPANTTADITRLQLTIAAPSGSPTKVYDGNTNHTGAGITLGALTNRAGSDVVSAAVQSASYNNANVASATQITIVYSISGSDSGNYDPPVNGTIAATITKANPTVTWPTNLTANEGETLGQITLPGNGSANITGSWSWTTGDTTPVGAEGSRSHSLTFTPSDSGNYNSTSNTVPVNVGPPLSSDVVLSPSPVSFTGITYGDSQPAARTVTITNNGTAPAIVSGITLNGVSPGSYTLGGTLNPTIGAGSSANFTVRPNANLPAGAHNAVITVTYDGGETITANVTLNVARKPVTITGLTAANKVYDGGTTATATGTAVISGNIDGASLTVSAGTAAFNNKDAGNGKTVTFSGYSLGGSAAANYELSGQPANTSANITKLQLTIAAPSGSPTKVYDGNTAYTGSGITLGALTNRVGSDVVSAAIQSATYNNANVASANQITIVYSISGSDSGNYDPPVNGTIAATITKANPSVTWPTGLTATVGQTLGDIALPGNGSANMTGSWSWTAGDSTSVGSAGIQPHNVTFTPTDTANYNTVSQNVNITVAAPPTHNTTFTLNFNHLQDENSLLPWQITGGGSGVLTLSRSGSGIDLELSGYPNITWEVDGVVKSTISTISLNPGDFTVFDEGSHILYVEVQTGGISYGRSIQFVVEP